jgi:hypothetical protein
MSNIPPHLIEAIRRLAQEKLPVEQIAFMTQLTTSTVRQYLPKRDFAAGATSKRAKRRLGNKKNVGKGTSGVSVRTRVTSGRN